MYSLEITCRGSSLLGTIESYVGNGQEAENLKMTTKIVRLVFLASLLWNYLSRSVYP